MIKIDKILIIHYHLKAGGVKKVIEREITGLVDSSEIPITLITGGGGVLDIPNVSTVDIISNPNFGYKNICDYSLEECNSIIENIKSKILDNSTKYSAIHIHNPSLGKNLFLTKALESIKADRNLYYHLHDFLEDRDLMTIQLKNFIKLSPTSSKDSLLYPISSNIKYIFANRDDMRRDMFILPNNRKTIYLPNPVELNKNGDKSKEELAQKLSIKRNSKWIIYPVRAISRKNIGEVILLSILLGCNYQFLITAAPENIDEIDEYNSWVSLSKRVGATVIFNTSAKVNFNNLYGESDLAVTTSIREGFGMAFLEPWLVGLAVVGRDLEMVTSDMRDKGVKLDYLYSSIDIKFKDNYLDFASLSLQEKTLFIKDLNSDEKLKQEVTEKNRDILKLFDSNNRAIIDYNRDVIIKEFSLTAFAKQILDIFSKRGND